MLSMLPVGPRSRILLCGILILACTTPVIADPKPLSKEEQAKVDQAIEKGIDFLKKAQTKEGDFDWKMYQGIFLVGQCALPAYALLESGVPADDPVIQKAAAFLRQFVLINNWTYELSLAILFFDRLDDPKDEKLIQMCALRLIAGQHRTGGWSYRCPLLNDQNAKDLLNSLAKLNEQKKGGARTRSQALEKLEVPSALQGLTVFQSASRLAWQEPEAGPENQGQSQSRVSLDGPTDNSNTQFALLGLWASRRHGVPTEPALELAVDRFERFHLFPYGFWKYDMSRELSPTSRKSMTCAGLIGLAIGRGLKLPTPGLPSRSDKDIHVLRGLAALSRQIGKPRGTMQKHVDLEDFYFLWSLERVGVLFDLSDIGGKDWYRWGAEGLVTNQKKGGWWPDPLAVKRSATKREYKATLCTSFALLFLKRSNPMKDLTTKLPFTEKELNQGIATLRLSDKYPVRTTITSSESRSPGEQSKNRRP